MLRWFRADLHVHTCLSPCGDLTMSPRRIVAEALRRQLDIVAITDHNSAGNVPAVMRAAEGTAVTILPGLEVCTSEEVHVLALFEALAPALELQGTVYEGITTPNDPDAFGLQVIANERDEVEGFESRLLIAACALSVDEVVERIHRLEGLAIAAHIDREGFGIIGQLGFIPRTLRFDALELSAAIGDKAADRRFRQEASRCFVRSSDAHTLDRLGVSTTGFLLEEPTCGELGRAFRRDGGRRAVPAPTEG